MDQPLKRCTLGNLLDNQGCYATLTTQSIIRIALAQAAHALTYAPFAKGEIACPPFARSPGLSPGFFF